MARRKPGKIVEGPELTAVTAEKVFGWMGVHKENGELIGKKQDKAGRWRSARVPAYSTDPVHAYAIDERMKQLGRWERYERELSRVTKAQNLSSEWATPEQRSRAAIRAMSK